jgi:hypothetical protein
MGETVIRRTDMNREFRDEYAAKVASTYTEPTKLGAQEYINQKWSAGDAQVTQNGPSALEDILASIYQANENIAVIHNALEALHDRVFGARPEETGAKDMAHAIPDNALARIHAALANQHVILARLEVVKNRLVDLA